MKNTKFNSYLKKAIIYTWEWLYLRGVFPSLQNNAVIFMLHRMSSPRVIEAGHSAQFLDQALNYLSRKGYNLVSLEDIYNNISNGEPLLKKAIAFTLDDGYSDQAEIAAPIFIKHKCPATIFLISGFIDGDIKPWDEVVKFIFNKADTDHLTLKLNAQTLVYDLGNADKRYNSMKDFRSKCKNISETEKQNVINSLISAAGLDSIQQSTQDIQPLSWDAARKLEKHDISFAPHTVKHSILSRCSNDLAHKEIIDSWKRLQQQLSCPCPVFAYPTGRKQDFTGRDVNTIRESDLHGAVMAESGYVSFGKITEADKYLIKRMSFPSNMEDLIQYCSCFELTKQKIRDLAIKFKYMQKPDVLYYLTAHIKYKTGLFNRYKTVDWSKISRLVFISEDNACRGPYSELRARQLGFNAISAGLDINDGTHRNMDAIKNASYRSIDLEHHSPRKHDAIDISDTDLIIYMEPRLVKQFRPMHNNCQFTLLGLWCSAEKAIIGNPCGKPDLFYESCFSDIDVALNNIKSVYMYNEVNLTLLSV